MRAYWHKWNESQLQLVADVQSCVLGCAGCPSVAIMAEGKAEQ